MSKLILIMIMVFTFSGCRSVPKKDLTTREGIIAAHFSVPVKEVSRLREKGYTHEESVGILFISTSSYLSEKEVIEKLKEGQDLKEISEDAGIDREKYTEKTQWVLKQIAEYSEEKQDPAEK